MTKGFLQVNGVDYSETFSPVIKPGSISTILSLAWVNRWEIRQLNVKNAFLHDKLQESVFMENPPGFINTFKPSYVCQLHKALYGIKQALHAWFDRFTTFPIAYMDSFVSLLIPS